MNEPKPNEQGGASFAPAPCSAQAEPRCAVTGCGEPAACELAVEREWFPVCAQHAVNKFMPRRPLRPNAVREPSRTHDTQQPKT